MTTSPSSAEGEPASAPVASSYQQPFPMLGIANDADRGHPA
jgi:hypothetical protein